MTSQELTWGTHVPFTDDCHPHLSSLTLRHVQPVCSASRQVTEKSTLELETGSAPVVKLDDKHYKLVDKMEALTLRAPSLVAAKVRLNPTMKVLVNLRWREYLGNVQQHILHHVHDVNQ